MNQPSLSLYFYRLSGVKAPSLLEFIETVKDKSRLTRLVILSGLKSVVGKSFTRLKSLFFRGVSFTQVGSTYETITWTTIPEKNVNDRDIYVSAVGSDAHPYGYDYGDGTFQGQITRPFLTISAGLAATRDTYGDRLWLRKGDTFTPGAIIVLTHGGVSSVRPFIIGSYGSGARPIIDTGSDNGIMFQYQHHNSHVWIMGLRLTSSTWNGDTGSAGDECSGIFLLWSATDILVEDCYLDHQKTGIAIFPSSIASGETGNFTDIRIRGNVFTDQFGVRNGAGVTQTSQGIFFGAEIVGGSVEHYCDGVVIEWNIFDHCGWLEPSENANAILNWYRHSGYITNGCQNITLKNNIIMRGDGVMMRSGGSIQGNFFYNIYASVIGKGVDPEPAGVTMTYFNNVAIDSRDILDNNSVNVPGGYGIDMNNILSGSIHDNIFANNVNGTGPNAISASSPQSQGQTGTRVFHDLNVYNNIVYNWGGICFDVRVSGTDVVPTGSAIYNNVFENTADTHYLFSNDTISAIAGLSSSGNKFHSNASSGNWFRVASTNYNLATWMTLFTPDDTTSTSGHTSYADPSRTVATYNSSIGGAGTIAAFVAACRAQSKDTWDNRYTAPALNTYIREGFI